MLGKTHLVGSLAMGHAALFGYSAYKFKDTDTPRVDLESASVLGFQMDAPMGVVTYSLMMLVLLMVSLFLLRVGSAKLRFLYLGIMIICATGLYFFSDVDYGFTLMGIAVLFALGSVFPDIDTPTSTIGKYFPFVGSIIGHRTVTHTIWAVFLLLGLTWYFDSVLLLAFTLGYTLHIIQDSFSRQGIAWFYPLAGGYITFGSGAVMKQGRKPGKFAYHTGGTGETVFFYSSIVVHAGIAAYVLVQMFV